MLFRSVSQSRYRVVSGVVDVVVGGAMDMGVGMKELFVLELVKMGIIDLVIGWYKNLNLLETLVVG